MCLIVTTYLTTLCNRGDSSESGDCPNPQRIHQNVNQGESLAFVIHENETWGCHNHLDVTKMWG